MKAADLFYHSLRLHLIICPQRQFGLFFCIKLHDLNYS